MKIADLPDRGLAVLIDGLILGFVIEAANKVLHIPSLNLGEMELSSSAQLAIILPVIYYGLMEGSPSGATVGKQAMSLRVTNLDGGRLSYPQAFLRAVVRLIPFSWILALGSNGRAVHDYVAGSKVVEL
jgi:uncharacterized RDD family membrane protein YckC